VRETFVNWLTTWFSLSRPVDRKFYAASGFGLMFFKYAVDMLIVLVSTGIVWTPLEYAQPSIRAREGALAAPAVLWALVAWTLPFYWIGASMTVRRAQDAGISAGWALLFFVPIVNYLVMLVLCFLPSAPASAPERIASTKTADIFLAVGASALIGVLMLFLSVPWLRGYGTSLFLGTPFVMGFIAGFVANRGGTRTAFATLNIAYLSVLVGGGVILLFAVEGLFCLVMALPLALFFATLGALLGREVARGGGGAPAVASLLVALPLVTGFESLDLRAPLREISTAIEIAAPPERVWPNVIAFSELPAPGELVFELGIAYPMRARIEGRGPGAIRTCEFSTGPFVEPITVWDEPHRLAFSVSSQPPTMHEWSPYQHVNAPHLLEGLVSERGEFRLVALGDGRTRLEGSTWYRNNIFPQLYWNLWSDLMIHAIHRRVLEHIRHETELSAS